jgi:hypothetical protein
MRREIDKDCIDCGGTGLVVVAVEKMVWGHRLIMGGCHCVRWIIDAQDIEAIIELGREL